MTKKPTSFLLAAALLAASWLTLGCASNGGGPSEPTASRSSGVEVFGVIDVGVSRTTTKSGR